MIAVTRQMENSKTLTNEDAQSIVVRYMNHHFLLYGKNFRGKHFREQQDPKLIFGNTWFNIILRYKFLQTTACS